jgi:hypothetical protein
MYRVSGDYVSLVRVSVWEISWFEGKYLVIASEPEALFIDHEYGEQSPRLLCDASDPVTLIMWYTGRNKLHNRYTYFLKRAWSKHDKEMLSARLFSLMFRFRNSYKIVMKLGIRGLHWKLPVNLILVVIGGTEGFFYLAA